MVIIRNMGTKAKAQVRDRNRHRKLKEFRNSFKKKCVKCGSTENLQLHHIDRTKKIRELTKVTNKPEIVELFENNEVLCRSCHIDTFRRK